SVGLTVAVALMFKWLASRRRRRAPLDGRQIGHVPGQQLQQRIDRHGDEMLSNTYLMLFALPLMFLVWAAGRIDWSTVGFGITEALWAIGALALFAYGLRAYLHHHRLREQAKDGQLAERVTGMQLNRLMAQGCIVIHDLPADGFNIDHIVISPRGIYAVETKSFRKPRQGGSESARVAFDGEALRFPDFIEKSAVEQAKRQARWLAKELRDALGSDYPVEAALALPGWYVEQPESVWRGSGVKVFSPMGNGCNFMAKDRAEVIDPTRRALAAKALAMRFPKLEW
ncbi:MAG: nuclease-related domain-containing protein, partial [Pseudomonadota bacterium]|nr:nuclease-related domain-containing protein [Pseudomonadota bacterium]